MRLPQRTTDGQRGAPLAAVRHDPDCAPGGPLDVVTWRRCRLLEAGFPPALAVRLATNRHVDLHALLQLVDSGCPPHLAARILAPVGEPG